LAPAYNVRLNFHSAGSEEVERPFDLQIRRRKSHSAAYIPELVAPAAGDSILPLSRGEKPPQEKAANKS
jgi:hypothetical protein